MRPRTSHFSRDTWSRSQSAYNGDASNSTPTWEAASASSAVPAFGPDTIQAAPIQSVVPFVGTDTIQAPIGSSLKPGTGPEVSASKGQSARFQLRSHTTKSGRKTQVPAKFKD